MNRHRKYLILSVAILGSISLLTSGLTYAKYISNSIWNYYLKSKGFYFESNELNLNSKKHTNTLWDGSPISITLSNSLNETIVTDYDINYEVECNVVSSDIEAVCKIGDTDSNKYTGVISSDHKCVNYTGDGISTRNFNQEECETKGYEWKVSETTKELTFNVEGVNGDEIENAKIEVIATSKSPYKKTLKGTYTLIKDLNLVGKVSMEHISGDNYDRLILTNSKEQTECVELKWDSSNLHIDVDKNLIKSYETDSSDYINKIIFEINAKDNIEYIFYKDDLNVSHDINDFILIESNGC